VPQLNGNRWSAENNGASTNVPSDTNQRLIVLGYITAVVMPPLGLILGLVLVVRLRKPNSKHASWIIVVSFVAAIVWVLALASGLLNPNTNTSI
jgi:hypothetical protein